MAILDTGNALYPNLVYAYRDQQEYVFSATLTNTSGTTGNDANGDFWQSAGTGSYLDSSPPTLTFTPSGYNELTFVVVGDFATTGSYTTAASMSDADANAGWSLRAEQADTGNVGFTYLNVADITGDLATPSGFGVIAASTQQTGTRFAVNGTSGALLAANTANYSSGTLDKFTIGNQASNTTYNSPLVSGDKVYAVYVFNKALSAAELESITSNPDQLFTASNTITVGVPTHINLEWDTTHELAVTDDTGTVSLASVTLSAPTGWETVAFTTAPNPATTESFYEYAQTDTGLGGAGYTMLAGDILAWETQTGLTIDGQTIPQVDPPATVSGSYKIFKDATKTWTSVSTFTVNDLGFPGDPAPVLSSPTGTATGAATASGTVTTDNGTGTLYYYASTNSTETAATIKASGSSQVVGAVGSQGVGVTGLTPETLYYLHYVQDDDGAQESNVVSSSSFTTLATSDVPATSRTSIFHIANYLRSLGTYNSSQCNELVVEWLVSEGITRTQINQMLYGYLGGLGYTGSFNDRLKAWSEDV